MAFHPALSHFVELVSVYLILFLAFTLFLYFLIVIIVVVFLFIFPVRFDVFCPGVCLICSKNLLFVAVIEHFLQFVFFQLLFDRQV